MTLEHDVLPPDEDGKLKDGSYIAEISFSIYPMSSDEQSQLLDDLDEVFDRHGAKFLTGIFPGIAEPGEEVIS